MSLILYNKLVRTYSDYQFVTLFLCTFQNIKMPNMKHVKDS